MKKLVFWKILTGFWLTTLLITIGVWAMFQVLRPPQPVTPQVTGLDVAVAAARSSIEHQGEPAFQQWFQRWPWYFHEQLRVLPAGPHVRGDPITDAAGNRFVIQRIAFHPRHGDGPFDIPWEVILVSVVGGFAFAGTLAWYLTTPVQRIRAGFGRLAGGDFSTRLSPEMGSRRDEIADLARDFDTMARHLEELVMARDRLLAGVSHELRSPLARMQLAIGLVRQDPAKSAASLERIGREAAHLEGMVDELLTLSKFESGVGQTEDYFDLSDVVRLVVDDASFEASSKSVEIQLDSAQAHHHCIVIGDGRLIHRAVENIVRNAVRFSSSGQRVRVVLRHASGNQLSLVVTDEGPGVPDTMLADLFKPFVQATGGDGKGFGLGMAIAERAVLAHNGAIVARNEASGFTVAITLPAAPIEEEMSSLETA